MSRVARVVVLLHFGLLSGLASPAVAQTHATEAASPTVAAEAATEQGRVAFEEGRFGDARAAFERALDGLPFGHASLPRTLYNLGRAQQEMGDHCAAGKTFGRYLAVAADAADERKRLEKASAAQSDSQALCDAQVAPALASAPATVPELPSSESERPRRIAPWIAAGGAVAALGTGVAFNLLARKRAQDGDDAFDVFVASGRTDAGEARKVREADDDVQTDAIVSYVGFGVGAALAGLSVWLFLSPSGGRSTANVAPVVGPSSLGVTGRF